MLLERIDSRDDPRVAAYTAVAEPELLRRQGLFVAESRAVVRTLLGEPRFRVRSLLVTEAARRSLEDALARLPQDTPVYLASRELMHEIAGYPIHRGCLALGERPVEPPLAALLSSPEEPALVLVAEGVTDPDNVGSLFRNALAFGARAVAVDAGTADPLYRKAIRTSMGAVLRLPYMRLSSLADSLRQMAGAGFALMALTPSSEAMELADLGRGGRVPHRVALVVGNEGAGLSAETLAAAHLKVRIPMAPGVDSVNVATAAAIALHWLSRAPRRGSDERATRA